MGPSSDDADEDEDKDVTPFGGADDVDVDEEAELDDEESQNGLVFVLGMVAIPGFERGSMVPGEEGLKTNLGTSACGCAGCEEVVVLGMVGISPTRTSSVLLSILSMNLGADFSSLLLLWLLCCSGAIRCECIYFPVTPVIVTAKRNLFSLGLVLVLVVIRSWF